MVFLSFGLVLLGVAWVLVGFVWVLLDIASCFFCFVWCWSILVAVAGRFLRQTLGKKGCT